jgi:tetratricopeptide (TPR) repeat protein
MDEEKASDNPTETPEAHLAEILARETLDDLEPLDALQLVGDLINVAGSLSHRKGLERALAWSEILELRLPDDMRLVLLYFCSNVWADVHTINCASGEGDSWAWEQPDLQQQMLLLRRVVAAPAFSSLHRVYRAQVLTNLGNVLSTLGRIVESIELRDRAIEAVPKFGMALGTRAESILAYGEALYGSPDRLAFCAAAIDGLRETNPKSAFYESGGYEHSIRLWAAHYEQLSEWLDSQAREGLPERHLGASEAARTYRDWALERHLFLDPLNDLGPIAAAAADRLHLPAFAPHDARAEMLMGYLDSMQQEYASARWALYEALTPEDDHFSDSGLAPHDTGDEPLYGLRIERLKTAFRTAYAMFDKIGFFLNAWLGLGIAPDKVTFRTVWVERKGNALRTEFALSQNWPLRGLYWLSKDLFEPDFKSATEPDAQAVAEIRNHLEHKYLRVVGEEASVAAMHFAPDPLVYVVKQSALEARALRLLRLARAALIYLVLAAHTKERRKGTTGTKGPRTTLPRL